ncbi:MAG: hypothetical protein JSS76_00455 [Bacteroidetes bacterium]|nr:hypothetical protein [Bacteroidota bacterium]
MQNETIAEESYLPKVIFEGTHLTYKTDICFAIAESPRIVKGRIHRYHLPLISAEWEILDSLEQKPISKRNSLITFQPEEEEYAMETYRTWIRLIELQRHWYWVIDRFHISTRSHQLIHAKKDYQFDWLEDRLVALDFRLVFCTRPRETFEEARRERLTYSETPSNYDNLQKFIDEQELMRELIKNSRLKTLEVDVSKHTVDSATNHILDWLGVPKTNPYMEARMKAI